MLPSLNRPSFWFSTVPPMVPSVVTQCLAVSTYMPFPTTVPNATTPPPPRSNKASPGRTLTTLARLTEDQLRTMERAREEKEAHGEIETAHSGYLGAQDTYYVGTIKSIGRIYQQTLIDTYTKVAFAKLYAVLAR